MLSIHGLKVLISGNRSIRFDRQEYRYRPSQKKAHTIQDSCSGCGIDRFDIKYFWGTYYRM